jgi:hypothetical protein
MRASREQRAERLAERAEKKRVESENVASRARTMQDAIPFGQPILVGHYSEKRDRNYREKIGRAWDRAAELSKEAKDLKRRAQAAACNTAIYADARDPIVELDARIAELEANQETMKKANVLIRKSLKGDKEAQKALVDLLGEKELARIMNPPEGYCRGYEQFSLSNNSANIRRLKVRREQLAALKASPRVERMVGEVKVIEDPEIARIQLIFPAKPDEATRGRLKAAGFRWAPSEGAWQRQLNNAGRYAAEQVLKVSHA